MVHIIQKTWKGYRCRKKIKLFRKLPDDIWNIVLHFIRNKHSLQNKIERILQVRIKRLYFTAPRNQLNFKLQTLLLFWKCINMVSATCKRMMKSFCLRLMKHSPLLHINSLLISATLEMIINETICD